MLDLLLIHPGGKKQIYQFLSNRLTAVEPPVWCGLIAGYVRRLGYSVEILDTNAENLKPEDAAEVIAKRAPRLAAVVVYGHQPSASTQHMPSAGALCRAIKEINLEQKILILGGHAAALPSRTLQEEEADFVSSGEGPKTVAALLEVLKSGSENFETVPDLWYFKNSEIKNTPPAPLITDLDQEMPAPAWDLLPMQLYRAHNWHCFGGKNRTPYASIYTTLGCPYRCEFCCIQAPFRSAEKAAGMKPGVNSYRFWSVENILSNIDHLVANYGIRNLKIADEMFVLNEKHVNAICEKLIERNYDLNIWAYARVDSISDSMIPKLKQAGFNWLALGIEAADAKVRSNVQKGYKQELITATLQKLREAGIHVIANYIFGLPEDNRETMQATLDLAVQLNTEFANFYCTMAYPGSALYEKARREEWTLPSSWSGYSQHSQDSYPLATRFLSSYEVLEFRDRAFQIYFSRPAYQEMMEKKFGPEARVEIENMLVVPLFRNHPEMTQI